MFADKDRRWEGGHMGSGCSSPDPTMATEMEEGEEEVAVFVWVGPCLMAPVVFTH